jgi:hypothetical protein
VIYPAKLYSASKAKEIWLSHFQVLCLLTYFTNISTITAAFRNSANWYAWYPFDWIAGSRIEVYCEVDQPTVQNYKCGSSIPGETKSITAYVSNLKDKSVIVFCAPFFTLDPLKTREDLLAKDPSKRKDVTWMKTTAHAFFHELTHLSAIESKTPSRLKSSNLCWKRLILISSRCYYRSADQSGRPAGTASL